MDIFGLSGRSKNSRQRTSPNSHDLSPIQTHAISIDPPKAGNASNKSPTRLAQTKNSSTFHSFNSDESYSGIPHRTTVVTL